MNSLQISQNWKHFSINIDMRTGFLEIGLGSELSNYEALAMAKGFTHYISNRRGKFIQCSDKLLNRMLKIETYPQELGLNALRLEHQLADIVDKERVMFSDFLMHREFEEMRESW